MSNELSKITLISRMARWWSGLTEWLSSSDEASSLSKMSSKSEDNLSNSEVLQRYYKNQNYLSKAALWYSQQKKWQKIVLAANILILFFLLSITLNVLTLMSLPAAILFNVFISLCYYGITSLLQNHHQNEAARFDMLVAGIKQSERDLAASKKDFDEANQNLLVKTKETEHLNDILDQYQHDLQNHNKQVESEINSFKLINNQLQQATLNITSSTQAVCESSQNISTQLQQFDIEPIIQKLTKTSEQSAQLTAALNATSTIVNNYSQTFTNHTNLLAAETKTLQSQSEEIKQEILEQKDIDIQMEQAIANFDKVQAELQQAIKQSNNLLNNLPQYQPQSSNVNNMYAR